MTRTQLIATLSVFTTASIASFAIWTANLWISSQPNPLIEQVLGATTETNLTPQATLQPYPVRIGDPRKPVVNARQYALYHAESGKLLFGKDESKEVPIASTTKLMTSYLVAQHANLKDEVVISRQNASQIGSTMGLLSGERITVENLLYGMMLVSGNDAAHTLAAYVGGILLEKPEATEEERIARFVTEMNSTAQSLSLRQTTYQDPAGLNDEGHSSALDLAHLTTLVNQNEVLRNVTTTAQTTVTDVTGRIRHELRNSNRLVADYFYTGVSTGKTGFTPAAGHCLVGSASRNGNTLIAVVLSTYSDDKEASALEARKLLDWGFANYEFQ